jgi:hypothetical protein
VTVTNAGSAPYTKREIYLGESIISNNKLLSIHRGTQANSVSSMTLVGYFQDDAASEKLRAWVVDPKDNTKYVPANQQRLQKWMSQHGLGDLDISVFLDTNKYPEERAEAVEDLAIP